MLSMSSTLSEHYKIPKISFYLFLLVGLLSYIFHWTTHNTMGVKGYAEVVSLLSFIFSAFYIFAQIKRDGFLEKIDLLLFLSPLFLIVLSALISLAKYGQPMFYGLIESRRLFIVYGFFPLVYLYRELNVPAHTIRRIFLYFGVFALLLGLLSKLDYIPKINANEVSGNALRQARSAVGEAVVVLSFFMLVSIYIVKVNIRSAVMAFLFLLGMVFIIQSRQVVIAAIFSVVINYFLWHGNIKSYLYSFAFCILLVLIISVNIDYVMDTSFFASMQNVFSEDYMEENVRRRTIELIIQDLSFLGNGALSLMWEDGFHRFYGEYFFLADVGIFGVLFQYGVFSLIYIFILFYFCSKSFLVKERSQDFWAIIVARLLSLYLIVGLPVAAPLDYRGALFFYLVFFYYVGSRRVGNES